MDAANPASGSEEPHSPSPTVSTLPASIGEYQASTDWQEYLERFEFSCFAQGIIDVQRKKALLLATVGQEAYATIKSVLSPLLPVNVPYKDLLEKIGQHFAPKKSVILSRFKFNQCVQTPGQSAADYISTLKRLAEKCDFGQTLDGMLRDRLVCGVMDPALQKRLLAEEDSLTFAVAEKLSLAAESVTRDVSQLTAGRADGSPAPEAVHLVTQRAPGRWRPAPESGSRSAGQPRAAAGQPRAAAAAEPRQAGGPGRVTAERPGAAALDGSRRGQRSCYRCGGLHDSRSCRFRDYHCHYCGELGHLKRKCVRGSDYLAAHAVTESAPSDDSLDEQDVCSVYTVGRPKCPPITAEVLMFGVPVQFEVDTGAASTLVSADTFRDVSAHGGHGGLELSRSDAKLRSYTGNAIPVLGEFSAVVKYEDQHLDLPVLVVDSDGPNLLGRDWLARLKLDWRHIQQVRNLGESPGSVVEKLKDEYRDVFSQELGCFKGVEVTFDVDDSVAPRFMKPRHLPYAYRRRVEQQLQSEVDAGVLEPVKTSAWACQIVPVLKANGDIRVCGNFKQTANRAIRVDRYPLPRVQDLLAQLAGGCVFAKLDLSSAYQQLTVSEEQRHLLTINTHRGLYRYKRVPYGVNAAVGLFQREMEKLLAGLPNVFAFLDDVLISGRDEEDLLRMVKEVLHRFQEAGVRVREDKCHFLVPSVEYLGHVISKEGVRPTGAKVEAVLGVQVPTNVKELQSFLGMVNYYSKFLPHRAHVLSPLFALLRKSARWTWGDREQRAFDECKQLLASDRLLVHYDPDVPLVLTCDASSKGIGAVLSHRFTDGTEKPVGFASRTLSNAEVRYSQIEREALGIIYGITVFRDYLYGVHFTLETDHKPLLALFGETRGMPDMTSNRLKRWALRLSEYTYSIRHKATREIPHADCLSRLPANGSPSESISEDTEAEKVLLAAHLDDIGSLSPQKLRLMTSRDPILSQVLHCIRTGWAKNPSADLQPYNSRQTELYEMDGVIMWGTRVIIPPKARDVILSELHACHFGAVKMKSVARSSVWWPGIDGEIERLSAGCEICQLSRPDPPQEELHPWQWPRRPWSRLHIDFAGPVRGKYYLVVVDSFSKWIEVEEMTTITAQATVSRLMTIFSRFGLPDLIVSDNGPTFVSAEFQAFLTRNGIVHRTTAPYMPSSNGLAERAVRELKTRLSKMTSTPVGDRISKWLFFYRTTPHSTTGETPSRLLLGYQPMTRFDRLKPSLECKVRGRQSVQVDQHKRRHTTVRSTFSSGDKVLARTYLKGRAVWRPATIVRCFHPMFGVQFDTGEVCKRHMNQLRSRSSNPPVTPHTSEVDNPLPVSQAPISSPNRFQCPSQPSSSPADPPRRLPEPWSGSPGSRRAAVPLSIAGGSSDGGVRAAPPAGAHDPGGRGLPRADDRQGASPARAAEEAAGAAGRRADGREERRYPMRDRRAPDRFAT